jgi:hypothetical protein
MPLRGGVSSHQPFDAVEDTQGQVTRSAAVQGITQQPPRALDFSALERGDSLMQQRFGLTLSLGLGAAGTFDVGTGAVVMPIEKQHPRP